MNFNFDLHNNLPSRETTVWRTLLASGFPTFLVGGAVRDLVLGKNPKDWDIATKATPKQIESLFRGMYRVEHVGASFGVMLVGGIEVATFRGDRYFGGGDKDVEITYVETIEEDLARRDFTMNAMAIDFNGELIDPFGGYNDLIEKNGNFPLVKFVGDADKRIAEDPNRIFRALRFAATLPALLDVNTILAITRNANKVKMVARERIRKELMTTMEKTCHTSYFWEEMRTTGILDIIFPEFSKCYGHDHGNYHDEDVWTHSMVAGNRVSTRFPLIKLAAYLHDVGKPRSYDPVERSFHQHQTHSADIVREWMTEMKFSNEEIRFVVNLVLIHMDGTKDMTGKARRKLKNKLSRYNLHWRDYVRLRIADRHANFSRNPFTISEIKKYIDHFTFVEYVPITVNNLALKGGEIIERFNLTPGPIVSTLQNKLLEVVLDEGEEMNTVENLEILIKQFLTDLDEKVNV